MTWCSEFRDSWIAVVTYVSRSVLIIVLMMAAPVINEKALRETQTLHAGCSKAEPKIFAPPQTPSRGRGMTKIWSVGDGHYLYVQIQFGEDWCTQFQIILVTDPHTQTPTNRQNWLQYTALQLAHSEIMPWAVISYFEYIFLPVGVFSLCVYTIRRQKTAF